MRLHRRAFVAAATVLATLVIATGVPVAAQQAPSPDTARPRAGGPVLDRRAPAERVRERPELWTDDSATYELADGSFKTEISLAPVHFRDPNGAWQRIDTALAAKPDRFLTPRATGHRLSLPDDLAAAPVRLERNGVTLAMRLEGGRGRARVAKDTAIYADALPGIDAIERRWTPAANGSTPPSTARSTAHEQTPAPTSAGFSPSAAGHA